MAHHSHHHDNKKNNIPLEEMKDKHGHKKYSVFGMAPPPGGDKTYKSKHAARKAFKKGVKEQKKRENTHEYRKGERDTSSYKLPQGRKYSHLQRFQTLNQQQKDILKDWGKKEAVEEFKEPRGAKRARHVMQHAARKGPPKSSLEPVSRKFLKHGIKEDLPISQAETSGLSFLQKMLGRTPEQILDEGWGGEEGQGKTYPTYPEVSQSKVNKKVEKADKRARKHGFSSLQDELRSATDYTDKPLTPNQAANFKYYHDMYAKPGQQEQQEQPQAQQPQELPQQAQSLTGRPLTNQLQTFEAPYMRQFQEQIAPEIAEKYVGAGNARGSGFQSAMMGAGAGLSENLASLKGNLINQIMGQQLQAANIGLGYAQLPSQRYGQRQQNVNMALPYAQLPAQRWNQQLAAAPAAYQAALYPQQQQQEMDRYATNADFQRQQQIMGTQPWGQILIPPKGKPPSFMQGIAPRIGSAIQGAAMGAAVGGPWGAAAGGIGGLLSGQTPAVNVQMPQPIGGASSGTPGGYINHGGVAQANPGYFSNYMGA